MNRTTRHSNLIKAVVAATALVVGAGALQAPADAAGSRTGYTTTGSPRAAELEWTTVVNNNDLVPPLAVRNFNSYNQPSVNMDGLVVVRARSRGGPLGQPTHGIYTRDMSVEGPIESVLDRTAPVPYPNNVGTTFVETPSFPRIDLTTDTIATRGNHQPVWRYLLGDGTDTRAGTTGIYTNPFGSLITGAAKLGAVPEFGFFEVPGLPGVPFDVFPGSPAITRGNTLVFKGNYTAAGLGRTGIYFRDLADGPAGGNSPVVRIADNTTTLIPGSDTVFGSTAPPSAVGDRVVFAGFDDEDTPALGGVYLTSLQADPPLATLVGIGDRVPGGARTDTFHHLGEGVAFDGRFVGFWGAWGDETTTMRLYCPTEGNQDRIDYCNQELVCADTGLTLGAPGITCDETGCYREVEVAVHQGIFVHDIETGRTRRVASTDQLFDGFLFWTFSGKTPCVGLGHTQEGADDGEPARWRSSAFVAVSGGPGATYQAAFKASMVDPVDGTAVDGIYLQRGPGQGVAVETVLDTTTSGQLLDPEAPAGSHVIELGLEREGLRGEWLALSAKLGIDGGEEADGMAGIYATHVPSR